MFNKAIFDIIATVLEIINTHFMLKVPNIKKSVKYNNYKIRFVISIVLLTVTTTFIISTNAMQSPSYSINQTPDGKPTLILADPRLDAPSNVDGNNVNGSANQEKIYNYTIKNGDTLTGIISDFGFSNDVKHILSLDKKILKEFSRFQSNKLITLAGTKESLQQLIYHMSPTEQLILSKLENNQFSFERKLLEIDKYQSQVSARIENSLYLAAKKAGMSDKLTINMANLLGWDIDFVYDIRPNDYFTVIYEEEFSSGNKIDDGDIIALNFYNNGKQYHIFRYIDSKGNKGYYNANGTNIRKAFLKSPLDFAYISSHFNLKRKHPILHKIRAHKGVDYAAKRGTPIRASGDGRIIWRARKGGYGKTIIIQHGNTYSTLYAHMSRYAKKQRTGSFVKQGQTIGYVGTTGVSTGPHLHYEFRVNNVHKNPMKVKLPSASPLAKSEMREFNNLKQHLLAKLNLLRRAYLASLEDTE